jgi:SAM-dependent methyltransferase
MINAIFYRLMYWFGKARWDTGITPPEVEAAFHAGDIPAGTAIDLGCGTGTNVIYMAQHGRQVVGIDFVPGAIAKARKKAQRAGVADATRFYVADVSRMAQMDLPPCSFALDIGCFHSLSPEKRQRYAEGLAALLVPGGRYMLYTLDWRNQGGRSIGIVPDQVKALFAPWFNFTRIEKGNDRERSSTWFWMERKPEAGG